MDLSHFDQYENYKHGPIQQDEAVLLYGLCKVIRPKTIVEFGIMYGGSSENFALAKDDDSFLYSFDVSPLFVRETRKRLQKFPNCHVRVRNCVDFEPGDIGCRSIDFVFLDCSHLFRTNQECIRRFMPCMSESGIVAIHDTGVWTREAWMNSPQEYRKKMVSQKFRTSALELVDIMPVFEDERKTVTWFLKEYPEYTLVNLHSTSILRCGITLLQKRDDLSFLPSIKKNMEMTVEINKDDFSKNKHQLLDLLASSEWPAAALAVRMMNVKNSQNSQQSRCRREYNRKIDRVA
jgi:predicted O-methyltransferase YrrM